MLYLTCTTITNVDLAHYGVSRAKDWVSVDCGTSLLISMHSYNVMYTGVIPICLPVLSTDVVQYKSLSTKSLVEI